MTEKVDTRILTLPPNELDEKPPTRPTIAKVMEIDAEVVSNRISFFFSRGTFLVDIAQYKNGLDGLLRDVREDNFTYDGDTSNWPDPPETPLSLKNELLTYVIYKLTPKNWQFAHDYPPFTIGKEGKDAKCYFEARRFDKLGNKDRITIKDRKPVADDCTVAYFIADGRKAKGFTGRYVHALNIHVELVYDERVRARVPIIIDPDIRYPGGSG